MNFRNLSTAIVAGLTVTCGSAFANDPMADPIFDLKADKANVFSYNYAEASYVSLDGNFDGFKFAGSYDVTKNLGVAASYMTTSAGTLDLSMFSVDAIYHFQFDKFSDVEQLKNMDLVLHAGIENGEYDFGTTFFGTSSVDDTGLRFGAKARVRLTSQIEAFADVSYTTLFSGDLIITGGGVYSVNEQIGVFASYELSDLSTLSIGGRFSF